MEILADMTLTASEATTFTSYVSGGGTLIAMHLDPQLAPVFGLTPTSGRLSEGYILASSTNPISSQIASQTLQCHGSADEYTLSGASAAATLYSSASTATSYPAVVTNSYGSGRSAAFTFDLAKSVALTRQGNPRRLAPTSTTTAGCRARRRRSQDRPGQHHALATRRCETARRQTREASRGRKREVYSRWEHCASVVTVGGS